MHELIEDFTRPGDMILDPFMGSGATLRAAKDLGRRAIGVEIDPHWVEVAIERMAQGVLLSGCDQATLFKDDEGIDDDGDADQGLLSESNGQASESCAVAEAVSD